MFGAQASTPAFGTPPSSTLLFGTPSSSGPLFGTPSSAPAFGTPSTPAFASGFGAVSSSSSSSSSIFSTPFAQQQQQNPLFQQQQQQHSTGFGFGFQTPFASPLQQTTPFPGTQLTTQMAPVTPLPFSLADRDIQAIVDAYKDEPGNPKYAFKHLLFSVTDLQFRVKPTGVSDIMWAEAMGKLEGMDSADRGRLWPQLVQGFKDLSQRLKLQDEVILSDSERLKLTQSNVKMLQRHFQADSLLWIDRLRQNEQSLQRRLLRYTGYNFMTHSIVIFIKKKKVHVDASFKLPVTRESNQVMRILEGLESKGCRVPLTKGEIELAEKLASLARQLKGYGSELSRRVQKLLTISRVQASTNTAGVSVYLPGSTKVEERSLADMQEVLQQLTEAISRLGNVLKHDIRDMEIIMSEDTEMAEGAS